MNKETQSKIVFHAGAVIMLGMLSGIPLSMVLTGGLAGDVNDWKISHMEGLLNGMLMLGAAAAGAFIVLSQRQEKVFYWFLVLTGYSNAFYGWVRGITGEAGLDFAPPIGNQIAAILGALPVVTAFGVIILLMIGARNSQ